LLAHAVRDTFVPIPLVIGAISKLFFANAMLKVVFKKSAVFLPGG
jgi:hypothetical protein